jgi:hypothetical protein
MRGWTVQVLSGRIDGQPPRETMRLHWMAVIALLLACSSGGTKSVLLDVSGTMDGGGDVAPGLDLRAPDTTVQDVPPLADTPLDDAGCGEACPPDWTCQPEAAECEGNAVTTCLEDGSGWTIAEPCPKVTTCEGGSCAPWPEGACAAAGECMATKSCEDATIDCIADCLVDLPVGVVAYAKEIFWCVTTQCEDDWQPGSSCFMERRLGECKTLFDTCDGECMPNCTKAECGDDGCGGSCGVCAPGFACDPNGKCLCQPDCDGKECGPNGCGAQCGVCSGRKPLCSANQLCEAQPPSPCGDGECSAADDETCFNCPLDCGVCPECGDGLCEEGELCTFCPLDCGPCDFGDCCAYHDFPGCDKPAVVECVCQLESDCCLFPWSNDCVLLATDCGAGC